MKITRLNYREMREAQIERKFPFWMKVLVFFAVTSCLNVVSFLLVGFFELERSVADIIAAFTFVLSLSFGFVIWLALRPVKAEKSLLQGRPWSRRFDAWKPPIDDTKKVGKE